MWPYRYLFASFRSDALLGFAWCFLLLFSHEDMLLVDYSEEYTLTLTPFCGGFPLSTVEHNLSLLCATTSALERALSTGLDLDQLNVLTAVVVNILYQEVWVVVVPAIVQGRTIGNLDAL